MAKKTRKKSAAKSKKKSKAAPRRKTKAAAKKSKTVKRKKARKAKSKTKPKTIAGRIAGAYKAVVEGVEEAQRLRDKYSPPGVSETE